MPNRDHCDQGGHFLNHTIRELTTHYAVVHKKSTMYYPQAKGLVESTNKILQMILKKIVNENRTDWDNKLQSALWAYFTTFKTNIHPTPFRMAFGLEAVMLIEFQAPSLRVQVKERLRESQSEQYQLEHLLELGEHRVASMAQLEERRRQRKAFVDSHCKGTEKSLTLGKPVLVLQTRLGTMLGKFQRCMLLNLSDCTVS